MVSCDIDVVVEKSRQSESQDYFRDGRKEEQERYIEGERSKIISELCFSLDRRSQYEQSQIGNSQDAKLMSDPNEPKEKNNIALARRIARTARHAQNQKLPVKFTITPLELWGIRLGILRRQKGYSLDELAERSGIDPDVIFALEVGQVPLGEAIALLETLGEALEVSARQLSRELAALLLNTNW